MPRGRKALPDAVKALKGNPGKRKLLPMAKDEAAGKLAMPHFVTGADEKRYFEAVAGFAHRFVRGSDSIALGRYAYYLSRWDRAKKALKGLDDFYETSSKHGEMKRVHPAFDTMMKMEIALLRLEDRLGLNPAARQTMIKGMLLGGSQLPLPIDDGTDPAPSAETAPGALGYLTQASSTAKH